MAARLIPQIDAATGLCAVIGNPVGHSLSPPMHNAAFRAAGINFVYLAFEITRLSDFVTGLRSMPNFCGVSITIPHKTAIIPLLDEVTPLARHVGSVNTITRRDGRLIGDTTDGPGTVRAFREAGVNLAGKRVLFLGAGGAVRAVTFAMADEGCKISILGRSGAKVASLVEDLVSSGAHATGGTLSDNLEETLRTHDIIVQGTPVGMYPHGVGETPISPGLLRPDHVVFDMVYRPLKTRLIEDAESVGCKTILGLEMLVNQAELQYLAWMGQSPPPGVMKAALLEALGATRGPTGKD